MVSSKNRRVTRSPYTSGMDGYYNPYEGPGVLADVVHFDTWRWSTGANCTSADPDLFFENEAKLPRSYLRRLCSSCPVIDACLQHALIYDEQGWWGGTSQNERRRLKRAS